MKDIDKAKKEINDILEKYDMKMGYHISFPVYKIPPDEVQLALKILQKHEMKVIMTINENKQKK